MVHVIDKTASLASFVLNIDHRVFHPQAAAYAQACGHRCRAQACLYPAVTDSPASEIACDSERIKSVEEKSQAFAL